MKTKQEIIAINQAIKYKNYIIKGGFIVAEKKTAKNLEELESIFQEVDNKYNKDNSSTKLQGELNLSRLDNIEKSSDEITQLAKDSLKDYYTSNVNNINSTKKSEIQDLENSLKTQTQNANLLKESVNKNTEEVKQQASNDALKRGLARSSIVINQLNAFDNAKLEEYNKIDKELTNSVNLINAEIANLNTQLEKALQEFDITYASKLNQEINNRTQELAEKQAEITKYNNEIAQIEAEYNKEIQSYNNDLNQQDFKNSMQLNEFVAKYGAAALSTVKNNEKYEHAFAYFSTMPVDQAVEEINKNESKLRAQLGNAMFNNLKNKFIVE